MRREGFEHNRGPPALTAGRDSYGKKTSFKLNLPSATSVSIGLNKKFIDFSSDGCDFPRCRSSTQHTSMFMPGTDWFSKTGPGRLTQRKRKLSRRDEVTANSWFLRQDYAHQTLPSCHDVQTVMDESETDEQFEKKTYSETENEKESEISNTFSETFEVHIPDIDDGMYLMEDVDVDESRSFIEEKPLHQEKQEMQVQQPKQESDKDYEDVSKDADSMAKSYLIEYPRLGGADSSSTNDSDSCEDFLIVGSYDRWCLV